MGKRKILIAAMGLLIIILCFAIYYTQRQVNIMRIAFNRSDREYALLKEDYTKLYNAYYSYDDKIMAMLNQPGEVHWSKDSAAFVKGDDKKFLFSFINKPTMPRSYYLWIRYTVILFNNDDDGKLEDKFEKFQRVDTLKSHQYLLIEPVERGEEIIVAPADGKNSELPAKESIVTSILL